MRFDLNIVASWINPDSSVLDLGSGRGHLLQHLKDHKNVRGHGIELDEEKVSQCISRGLSVIQGDINEEIKDYPDGRFDYVVLSQTLQQVYNPAVIIGEMLRVAGKGIVSFPNFSHWRIRSQLLLRGCAPVSRELPYQWYDTPNIRVITIKDFRRFCQEHGFNILRQAAIDTDYRAETGHVLRILSNCRAKYGIFLLGR